MSRIHVLDQAVVDRIAAGEVVERPVSVVKELVENALDAGATRIEVRVQEGGARLIEVVDDGHGMDATDAALAFVQHATSKVASVHDLDAIATLGFRGEALASIASVARVELLTCTGEEAGVRVRVDGGGEPSTTATAAPRGTRVRVRDLFYNTPARRKHLRTSSTEFGRIAALVEELALLRPDVHLALVHDGKERLVAPPVAGLDERVHQVLGAEVADLWIPVHDVGGRVTVRGGVSDPLHSRRDRRRIHLFVNGRAIQDSNLAHAVRSAYGTRLEQGRHPVAALFLQLPVEDVDVNVHPRKAEVRFVDPGRVFGSIRRAVQQALARHGTVPELPSRPESGRPAPRPDQAFVGGDVAPPAGERAVSLPLRDWTVAEADPGSLPAGPRSAAVQQARPIAGTRGAIQPLAQYANTYILAADDDGLLVIDQHVAHERVLYERILAARAQRRLPVQRLLVPETLELSASEAEAAASFADTMAGFGFEIEPFGGTTWTIRSVPELLGSRSATDAVRALLETLAAEGDDGEGERLEREIAASIACHSAVRANQPLSAEVMSHLVAELSHCEAPTRCPHGRPVLLRLSHGDIERQLHRH